MRPKAEKNAQKKDAISSAVAQEKPKNSSARLSSIGPLRTNAAGILDTSFRENLNQPRTGNTAENLRAFRRIVLNILNAYKTIKKKPAKEKNFMR